MRKLVLCWLFWQTLSSVGSGKEFPNFEHFFPPNILHFFPPDFNKECAQDNSYKGGKVAWKLTKYFLSSMLALYKKFQMAFEQ